MWSYRVHGLRVDCAFELQGLGRIGDDHGDDGGGPDVSITVGADPVDPDAIPGRVILESGSGEPGSLRITESDDGWIIRYPGFADFGLSRDRRSMTVLRTPALGPEWLEVLAIGNPLAFLLALEGDVALHSSAVSVGGRAIAFVGPSGLGKSTLASSLATVLGATVISDDLLRIGRGPHPLCYRGATELRLRDGNASEHVAGDAPRRRTVDGRVAVHHPSVTAETMPLTAVVLPRPDHLSDRPSVERVSAADALFDVMGQTRLVGWRDPEMQRRHFEGIADLVDHVPVLVAHVPWGRFGSDCLGELVDLIAVAAAGAVPP